MANNTFAIIVSGRLVSAINSILICCTHFLNLFVSIISPQVQTDFQQVENNKFLITIPEADNINHLVVFMTGSCPFPDGMAGAGLSTKSLWSLIISNRRFIYSLLQLSRSTGTTDLELSRLHFQPEAICHFQDHQTETNDHQWQPNWRWLGNGIWFHSTDCFSCCSDWHLHWAAEHCPPICRRSIGQRRKWSRIAVEQIRAVHQQNGRKSVQLLFIIRQQCHVLCQ